MACLELDSQFLSDSPSYGGPSNLHLDNNISDELLAVAEFCSSSPSNIKKSFTSSPSNIIDVPKPPPFPDASYGRTIFSKRLRCYSYTTYVPKETKHAWDRLFDEGYEADVRVLTDDKGIILAHSSVLGITSPVLRNMLEHAKVKGGFRCIKICGVPLEAAHTFIRFLYSSCYEQDEMKKYVLHLLVMSHTLSIPSLKKLCINQLEHSMLTTENVVDVLQLARQCDAPRLSLLCVRLVMKDFKTISISEGWKVMKRANPSLEQELLESLVEADSVS